MHLHCPKNKKIETRTTKTRSFSNGLSSGRRDNGVFVGINMTFATSLAFSSWSVQQCFALLQKHNQYDGPHHGRITKQNKKVQVDITVNKLHTSFISYHRFLLSGKPSFRLMIKRKALVRRTGGGTFRNCASASQRHRQRGTGWLSRLSQLGP